jgi:16S rRNA (cytosine967-C5)-methyltransferase
MPSPARTLALSILATLEHGRATLADRLASPEIEALPPVERRFLNELVLGTLRLRGLLDFHLQALLGRPLQDLEPAILADILRIGAHQVLHLRVPARAAVNEAVELAAQHAPRAKGLVNAVLRRLAREGPTALPDAESAPLPWLTSAGSLPTWLAQRWLSTLGPQRAVARARALLQAPQIAFRLNPRAQDAWERVLSAELAPTPLTVPGAFRAQAGHPQELALAGLIALQDQGSQLAGHVAARGTRVLDACAAPGGKSMLIGDLLGPSARVIAAEISLRRLWTMRRLVAAWGATNVVCTAADGLRPPFRGSFDAVLVDAPCSGLGTIARKPDIRWRLREEDIARHSRRQRALLISLSRFVRPGGLLVYATCSLEDEETSRVVSWLRRRDPSWRLAPTPQWSAPFAADGTLRIEPEQACGDGFYVAALERP